MKAKIYSSEYMKSSSKGQRWIPAFAMIAFLLAFPVAELILIGKWNERSYTQSQLSYLYSSLWSSDFLTMGAAVAAVTAFFAAVSGFWYLYSPRKVDFYHSLPVKRSALFYSIYASIFFPFYRRSFRIIKSSGVFFHSAGDRLHRYHADGSPCMGRIVYLQYHSGSDAAVKRTFIF